MSDKRITQFVAKALKTALDFAWAASGRGWRLFFRL